MRHAIGSVTPRRATWATRARRLLEELAEGARARTLSPIGDDTAWIDFFITARGLIDVRVVDPRFAEALSHWVHTGERQGAPDRAVAVGPRYERCIPVSATIDCGLGEGWEALTFELLEDAVEINIAGPFPRWSADRDATGSRLFSWTLRDASGATFPVTGFNQTGPALGWGMGPVNFACPALHGNASVELRGGGRSCLQVNVRDGLNFATRALRHRSLSAADAVGNYLREGLDGIDSVAQYAPSERQHMDVHRLAEAATRLANRLVDVGALASDSGVRRQLDEVLTRPLEAARDALPMRVGALAPLVRAEDRVLRRVVPVATEVSVGGARVVVRWMSVFTDLVVVVVTAYHGNPSGHDDGVNRVRWWLRDRWGWSRVLTALNDWCGRPWTTFYLAARRPSWKGKQLILSADAGGEEVLIPIEAASLA